MGAKPHARRTPQRKPANKHLKGAHRPLVRLADDEFDDKHRGGELDRRIAALAAGQRGVVSRAQLEALGASRRQVGTRLANGRLHRVHRGVYLVGHTAAPHGAREVAALLALGPGAVISYRSAAALWDLLPYPATADVCVTIAQRRIRSRPGVTARVSGDLRGADVRVLGGIPVTSPARTVAGLAVELGLDELEHLAAEAQRRSLARPSELIAELDRLTGRPGARALRTVLDRDGGPAFTRSEAERRLLRLVREAGLPTPLVNAKRHGYELDFLWPAERLVVEVDGLRFHSDLRAQRVDRRRDAELVALGYSVMRFTWDRLTRQASAVVAQLAAALTLARHR